MAKGTQISKYIIGLYFISLLLLSLQHSTEGTPLRQSPFDYTMKKYQPYGYMAQKMKRGNAEIMNGLLAMDLGQLSAVGKRSNAELINGLIGMDLDGLYSAGK
uniref:Secreted protein n=1 Tax=Parastrongyloides trichosuri TaxID=131310 RepID=A0A0N4Z200_PARTI